MRIRILRSMVAGGRAFVPGSVVEIDKRTAEAWLKAGVAEEDKALDGPEEVKASGQKAGKSTTTKRGAGKSGRGKKASER